MLIRDLLVKNKVPELKELAKIIGLTGYSKLKKDELIASIEKAILNEEYAKKVFFLANDKELELFEQKATSFVPFVEEEIGNYLYFYKSLIYFLGKEEEFVLPEEFKVIYDKVNTEEFRKRRGRFHLVFDYCYALTNLYGIVTLEQVIKVFNDQNEVPTDKEEVLKVYGIVNDVKECFFDLIDNAFVHEAVTEEAEGYHILLEKQGDKPYYVPEKDVLLCYADEAFFEQSDAFLKLVEYLAEVVVKDEVVAAELATQIQYMYSFGEELQKGLELFEEKDIEMEEEVLRVLIDLLVDVYNNTRFWENRGFSPIEMIQIEGVNEALAEGEQEAKVEEEVAQSVVESLTKPMPAKAAAFTPTMFAPTVHPTFLPHDAVVTRKKIGRNDPCPCGSGQKFKRCCGK